jgi:hypothetical protein
MCLSGAPRGAPVAGVVLAAMLLASCSASGVADIMEASVGEGGRELVLTVDSCNADLSADVEESPSRVTVIVNVRNHTSDDCADVVIVHLEEPLGERELVDASGAPVTVRITDP